MNIGKQIKSIRQERGLSQEELARAIGATKSAVSRYEADKRQPDYDQLQSLAAALDVSVLDLLGANTPMDRRLVEQQAHRTGKSISEVEQETAEDILDLETAERLIAALESADRAVVQSFSRIPDGDIMIHLNSIVADELTRAGRILTLKRAYELANTPGYGRFAVQSTSQSPPEPREKDTTLAPDAPQEPPEGE